MEEAPQTKLSKDERIIVLTRTTVRKRPLRRFRSRDLSALVLVYSANPNGMLRRLHTHTVFLHTVEPIPIVRHPLAESKQFLLGDRVDHLFLLRNRNLSVRAITKVDLIESTENPRNSTRQRRISVKSNTSGLRH